MSHTYCPPFGIVAGHLVLILFSLGMLANILHVLSDRAAGTISPMTYFFILGFVAVIVLSSSVLVHMLFVKRVIIPPPCLLIFCGLTPVFSPEDHDEVAIAADPVALDQGLVLHARFASKNLAELFPDSTGVSGGPGSEIYSLIA